MYSTCISPQGICTCIVSHVAMVMFVWLNSLKTSLSISSSSSSFSTNLQLTDLILTLITLHRHLADAKQPIIASACLCRPILRK